MQKPRACEAGQSHSFISRSSPPFLIMPGDHDSVAPLEQSQLLYEKLRAAGVLATLYVVPGGGHATGFDRPEIARMIGVFFTRHLHPPKQE
jgi:acetyl esterase/lipase